MNERQEIKKSEGENDNLIQTKYFDIDTTEIDDSLEDIENSSPNRFGLIRLDKSHVPSFVNLINLDYKRPEDLPHDRLDDEAVYHLHGLVEFNPETVDYVDNWQQNYLHTLEWQLSLEDYEVRHLRHEASSIYVSIGDARYYRVSTESKHDLCTVTTNVVDNIYPDEESEQEVSYDEAIKQTAELFGRSLDCFVDCFSEDDNVGDRFMLKGYNSLFKKHDEAEIGKLATGKALELIDVDSEEKSDQPTRQTGLDKIGGLFAVKNRLKQISDNLSDPESAAMYGVSPAHFILYGQPGTGKTSLAEAFAEESGAMVKQVSVADISDKWTGGSAQNIKNIFDSLVSLEGSPKVLFIDEIDAIIGHQAQGSNQSEAKREFLKRLNDLSENHPNILVAGATNSMPDDLDPAFVRSGRFETIGINTPTSEERIDIWMTLIAQSSAKLNPLWENTKEGSIYTAASVSDDGKIIDSYNFAELASITEGWSGADMAKALENARRDCYDKYKQSGKHCNLTNEILINSVRSLRRS